jgi:hypothetical protein
MTNDGYVRLEPSELVAGRPFTHPEQCLEDVATLQQMADRLRLLLSQSSGSLAQSPSFALELDEAGGRRQRIIVSRREALLASGNLTAVGFFGLKRPGTNAEVLAEVDAELVGEFPLHPGILSYSSLELADGNWGNLVLLNSPEAREHWRTSEHHLYAVRELAPAHYLAIRLHNAALPGGLMSGRALALQRTKYYDFQSPAVWQAVREFGPA